jgi:glycosyltransferase involved in cell wall biosynthesis
MSRGLSEQVKIVGRSECVYHLLKRTDILIHPSTENEDLPNVISEAMSLGIPVIGSKAGGIVEQIDHDRTGLLVEPGSEVELAEAIYKLMSNLGLRSKLGGQGLSKFKQNFSEAKALAAYKALYFD